MGRSPRNQGGASELRSELFRTSTAGHASLCQWSASGATSTGILGRTSGSNGPTAPDQERDANGVGTPFVLGAHDTHGAVDPGVRANPAIYFQVDTLAMLDDDATDISIRKSPTQSDAGAKCRIIVDDPADEGWNPNRSNRSLFRIAVTASHRTVLTTRADPTHAPESDEDPVTVTSVPSHWRASADFVAAAVASSCDDGVSCIAIVGGPIASLDKHLDDHRLCPKFRRSMHIGALERPARIQSGSIHGIRSESLDVSRCGHASFVASDVSYLPFALSVRPNRHTVSSASTTGAAIAC